MTLQILVSLILSTAAATPRDWIDRAKATADTCGKALATLKASRAPQITQLRDGQIRHVTPLTLVNLKATWQLGDAVFPEDRVSLARNLATSLVPTRLLPRASLLTSGMRMEVFDTYVLESDRGYPIGLVGLYLPARTLDLWIGSFGIYPRARREGLERALVDWSVSHARGRGYIHLRAWSTDGARDEAMNRLYLEAGFGVQKLEACDPNDPSAQIVIWSKALQRNVRPERFLGNYAEVLYGLTAAEIAEGVRLYDVKRSCE